MIETILMLALAAAGCTLIIRALVPSAWLLVKPFACDLCMSWWGSLGAALIFYGLPRSVAFLLPFGLKMVAAVPVSMLVLKVMRRLTPDTKVEI